MTQATFGGGCFWCLEAVFELIAGVETVVSGYAGGTEPNPSYEAVCAKQTGHAEVLQVTFNPEVVSYRELLVAFFLNHDPTTLNRQGNDVGPQYRSIILTHSEEQSEQAASAISELNSAGLFSQLIVTEVKPLTIFYPAEAYHQGYYRRNPLQGYCQAVISPKVAKFRKQFSAKLKLNT
ncbi:MAG: peptide-methionine (S)-S-oxide reductase MsrA [Fimbriiglobus sp.]